MTRVDSVARCPHRSLVDPGATPAFFARRVGLGACAKARQVPRSLGAETHTPLSAHLWVLKGISSTSWPFLFQLSQSRSPKRTQHIFPMDGWQGWQGTMHGVRQGGTRGVAHGGTHRGTLGRHAGEHNVPRDAVSAQTGTNKIFSSAPTSCPESPNVFWSGKTFLIVWICSTHQNSGAAPPLLPQCAAHVHAY